MFSKYFTYTKKTHYLDAAATTIKPDFVIDSIKDYYINYNANAGRGSHNLALKSTEIIEDTRKKVAKFLNVENSEEIVFTKNTTESLNIIAYTYAVNNLKKNDEILIGVSNHHANLIPWQYVSNITGAKLKYIKMNEYGILDLDDYQEKLSDRTKIVAISYVVNATGVVNYSKEMIEQAHKKNAIFILDIAQSIPHFKHNFKELNPDFATFSAHKMYSSFGVGILYAKKELLKKMSPFLYGGNMIEYVDYFSSYFLENAYKYEGGTIDTASIYAFNKVLDFYNKVSYEKMNLYLNDLYKYLLNEINKLDFVTTYFTKQKNNNSILSFNVNDIHSHDVSEILNTFNVQIRTGQHCTSILMKEMNISSNCRVSLGIYNTKEDIDFLISGLKKVKKIFLD